MKKVTSIGIFYLSISITLIGLSFSDALPGHILWRCKGSGVVITCSIIFTITYWVFGSLLTNKSRMQKIVSWKTVIEILSYTTSLVFPSTATFDLAFIIDDYSCYQKSYLALANLISSVLSFLIILCGFCQGPLDKMLTRWCDKIPLLSSRIFPAPVEEIILVPIDEIYENDFRHDHHVTSMK